MIIQIRGKYQKIGGNGRTKDEFLIEMKLYIMNMNYKE
jgi:hypothetical protein